MFDVRTRYKFPVSISNAFDRAVHDAAHSTFVAFAAILSDANILLQERKRLLGRLSDGAKTLGLATELHVHDAAFQLASRRTEELGWLKEVDFEVLGKRNERRRLYQPPLSIAARLSEPSELNDFEITLALVKLIAVTDFGRVSNETVHRVFEAIKQASDRCDLCESGYEDEVVSAATAITGDSALIVSVFGCAFDHVEDVARRFNNGDESDGHAEMRSGRREAYA
jgi:hypothetical protein